MKITNSLKKKREKEKGFELGERRHRQGACRTFSSLLRLLWAQDPEVGRHLPFHLFHFSPHQIQLFHFTLSVQVITHCKDPKNFKYKIKTLNKDPKPIKILIQTTVLDILLLSSY